MTHNSILPFMFPIDDSESLHQQLHHLSAGQKRSAQPQQNPLPGMSAVPSKKSAENAKRSRWKYDAQALEDPLQRLPERGGPSHGAQNDENHRRKSEKHVEGD